MLRLAGSALVGLGGFTPGPTELAVLFALCGGMGSEPLRTGGGNGSIAFGFVWFSFVWFDCTEKMTKWCQKETHKAPNFSR